ncbi:hypothetical protein M3Y97_00163700 [Aphelenchoides bicaudatus]|nr:hypothetical protein M3Y97_00163700 [Aphelenchoides bicaudatus]
MMIECKQEDALFEFTQTKTTAKPSMNPPNLKHSTLVATIQKKLLKFVYFGKQRTITVKLSRDQVDSSHLIEGSFLEIRCDVDKKKYNDLIIKFRHRFSGFSTGFLLDPSVFNWRVQSLKKNQRILLAPTLSEYDNGLFECFIEDDFRGGVHLHVKTIWNSVFLGLGNYLIGALFSVPLVIIATAYRLYRPEAHAPKPMDDLFEDEEENLHMEFDEMLLNLKKVEQT